MHHITLAFAFCLLASTSFIVARQQQLTPAFRAGVDLLTIEAAVIDRDGRPARDLQPADFTVTVDGKPRKVLFARFSGLDTTTATDTSIAAGPIGAAPSTNTTTAGGRIVVFVVDRDSIKSGNEKALLETSAIVLDGLTSQDAAGLLVLPGGGAELTREHARVREALSMITGTRPRQSLFNERNISWSEALSYEQRDARVIAEVVERECYALLARPDVPAPSNQCPVQLTSQATELLQTGRAQLQTTMAGLDRLADQLAQLRGSKHVVLMSGGLAFGQDLLPYYNNFARKAAAAQAVVYAIHLDQPDSDASDRKAVTSAFGGREMSQGLSAIAGMTGGAFFNGIGRATGVFERITLEMNTYYELGVESLPDDVAGKPRDLEVKVTRPGASVRARRQIMLPDEAARNVDRVRALLQQPTDLSELPVAVSAYTTRGDDPKTLRVLLSADIGNAQTALPAEWGFVVISEGNPVASGRQRIEAVAEGSPSVLTSARLAPGKYRLRFVATAADGKVGVIDTPLIAGLRAAGDLQISDLIVGTAEGGRLRPRTIIVRGTPMSALIELISASPEQLAKSRAIIEIVPSGSTDPVQRFQMAARSGTSDVILLNEAQIETTALAPGRYTASVIPMIADTPVGRVSRVFQIVAQ